MGHIRQKPTLGLVGPVRGLLLQLEHPGLVGLLLLLGPHFIDAAGVVPFRSAPDQIDKGDQGEDDGADQHVECQLLPDLREQLPVADADDDVPLVHDFPDKDGLRFTACRELKDTVLRFLYFFEKSARLLAFRQEPSLAQLVMMGNHHAVVIDDKTVALFLDAKRRDNLLDVMHLKVDRKHVPLAGELSADGDDDLICLGINVGRDDLDLPLRRQRGLIPVSLCRLIALGGNPGQAVEILAHDIAVQPGNIHVEIVLLMIRLLHDIVQDVFLRASVPDHIINGIRRHPQSAFRHFQIVFELCRHIEDPVRADFMDIFRRHAPDNVGGIHFHHHHKAQYEDHRQDPIKSSASALLRVHPIYLLYVGNTGVTALRLRPGRFPSAENPYPPT